MKTPPHLTEARAIVRQMPVDEAERLRRILTLPCAERRHAGLIARERLPLGALMVAEAYRRALSQMRRAA